jgi:hypothetical protein
MQYISAEWVEVAGGRSIKAIGDDGNEYWVSAIDSDVPPWPAFLETEAGKAFVAETEA